MVVFGFRLVCVSPLVRREYVCDDAEQSCFARSVGRNQGVYMPLFKIKREVVEYCLVAESSGDLLDANHGTLQTESALPLQQSLVFALS